MDYYIDIKLKPDAEIRENVLMNKVYTKLHKMLFDLNSNDIGVSFPDYKVKLGKVLRIHGTNEKLLVLQGCNWLGGLSGYCDTCKIQVTPGKVEFRIISRKQSNMTQAKLNRLIKRGSISADKIKNYKTKMFQQGLDNPYLELESSSNGNKHRRYISFGELDEKPSIGKFDCFGLSKTATVPCF